MYDWFINQNLLIKTILASIFTFLLTSIGASIVFFFKKVENKILNLSLAISAGIMLAATFWSLLEPGINMSEKLGLNVWLTMSLGIIIGTLFLILCDKLYQKNGVKNKSTFMMIFSITIHNIPEGLAVGVAFGSLKYGITGVTLISAISLAIGIGLQNFPEGLAVSLPLRKAGYSRFKSFFIGSLTGLVEPISSVIGLILVLKVRILLPFLLSFASGAMLYVIINELIPESQNYKNKGLITISTILGFVIMMILDISLG